MGWLFLSAAMPACHAYPTSTLQLHEFAKAPILATCVIESTRKDAKPIRDEGRVVTAHATLHVLRTFPQGAISDQQIVLDYDTYPDGYDGMSGPSVPSLITGSVLTLPLKPNSAPRDHPWRLITDRSDGLVIPAISQVPGSAQPATSGEDFVLKEIASALSHGTPGDVLAEASYLHMQTTQLFSPQLMQLLQSNIGNDKDRWAQVAASLVSSIGIPRPTVAQFRSLQIAVPGTQNEWSLVALVLQRIGDSPEVVNQLIHQTLLISNIQSWGAANTLREFAHEPALIQELTTMLHEERPGSLYVAREMITAGERSLLDPATTLSLHYLKAPPANWDELRTACWVLRDFGSDQQFGELVSEIKKSQYKDTPYYNALWRAVLWSDNPRESVVLQILLRDDRTYYQGMRYSDVAHGESTRLAKLNK
jgi:hypothetical protein